jgi:phospholipid/cholesterol/gamma-HCH transport system ATP-binding protein
MPKPLRENTLVIEVRDLEIGYGSFILMREINFSVKAREVMVIMGGSGSGKSTLLKHLVGLKEVEKGEILYHGKSFSKASPEEELKFRRLLAFFFKVAPYGASER